MSNNVKNGTVALNSLNITDIFKKYNSQLRGYISKRIPSKEDCEDILQNVFYQLSKVDMEEAPIEHISGWLYSVARNQIIDRSRKQKSQNVSYAQEIGLDEEFTRELREIFVDTDSSPENEMLKQLIWEELEMALSELPEEQRAVFELTELEGIPFKEISETTGIAVNTLISRKRYAVLHLRKRLYKLYEELLLE